MPGVFSNLLLEVEFSCQSSSGFPWEHNHIPRDAASLSPGSVVQTKILYSYSLLINLKLQTEWCKR